MYKFRQIVINSKKYSNDIGIKLMTITALFYRIEVCYKLSDQGHNFCFTFIINATKVACYGFLKQD